MAFKNFIFLFFLSAAQTSQHERERTQVTGKEKWRGDTQEEGLLPKAGGCGVKGEKNQKPHNPIPQIPVELVGVGWEYSSGRKEKPKRNSTEGVWEGAGLLACLGLDFYRWRVFSVATIRQSCAFSL